MTREEFFDWAQAQEIRYEFDGFEPVAMTGGTANHSLITQNVLVALRTRLRGGSCRPMGPDAGVATDLDLQQGAAIARETATRAPAPEARRLQEWARAISDTGRDGEERIALSQSEALHELARKHPDPDIVLTWDPPLTVTVDRERARFSSWYEMFPRSCSVDPEKHGTLADVDLLR